jgi:hypothetical protein
MSLTKPLYLGTSAGRAMVGLVAVSAEFEREILRNERDWPNPHQSERYNSGRPLAAACIRPRWKTLARWSR